MKTRYAATHVGSDGLRRLTRPNQGRYHWDNPEEGERWLDSLKRSNTADRLHQIYGDKFMETARVDPMRAYDHGDSTRTIITTVEEIMLQHGIHELVELKPDVDLAEVISELADLTNLLQSIEGAGMIRLRLSEVVEELRSLVKPMKTKEAA